MPLLQFAEAGLAGGEDDHIGIEFEVVEVTHVEQFVLHAVGQNVEGEEGVVAYPVVGDAMRGKVDDAVLSGVCMSGGHFFGYRIGR